jgi:D-alanyl-lipoteichoic acid acyltransferase DltB (MBOAT superfamily)
MMTKWLEFGTLFLGFLAYPAFARLVLKGSNTHKWWQFATLNCVIYFLLFLIEDNSGSDYTVDLKSHVYMAGLGFLVYVGSAAVCWLLLKKSELGSPQLLAAFLSPIALLLVFRYAVNTQLVLAIVGVSYMSLRLCHLVSEVRNEVVEMPTLVQYFSFAFFPPVMFVGPITHYSQFLSSIEQNRGSSIDTKQCLLRILVGAVKFTFLSATLAGITYGAAFLPDGHHHSKLDLLIAVAVYPLYLYCNFSGLCDLAIGASGLCGVQVMENFDRPFSSRNFQEFWTRWHISLSQLMRDLVFTPMVKGITRKFGAASLAYATAAGIMTVFVLIGAWHGLTLNFLLFGLSQGLGVVFVFCCGNLLKKRLGKQRYLSFRRSKILNVSGMFATYSYFAITLFLFANTMSQSRLILISLRQ